MPVDADAGQAEALYALRSRLIRFFSAKGRSAMAEELADEVILRVLKKLTDGAAIENLAAFTLGVARHVWFEFLRGPELKVDPLPEDFEGQQPEPEPAEDLDCLERSLRELLPAERSVVLRFYGAGADDAKNKELRKKLAEELGISTNALFLRVSKSRKKLAELIEACRRRLSLQDRNPAQSALSDEGRV